MEAERSWCGVCRELSSLRGRSGYGGSLASTVARDHPVRMDPSVLGTSPVPIASKFLCSGADEKESLGGGSAWGGWGYNNERV